MPIYEYGCDSCEALVERIESFKSPDPPPECCGTPMRKLISTQLHILKGTGFYKNDWGTGQHHLQPRDQAIRAARECKERDLVPSRPRPVTDNERRSLEKIAR